MANVTLQGVSKSYGTVTALRPLDLDIPQGEFLTLLGPSGCGKTTTLRLIAGFIEPSAGRIRFGGDDVTDLPPQKREIGMVFQDYALFPHMTIADNIGFALAERGTPAAAIRKRVGEMLDLIRLPDVAERYPAQLSGGQQQRVAVARAVAHSPRVLLMDEPLGALDLKLREAMQNEISAIQHALKITTVYVTHDQTEAMSMSDRIAVMNDGRIEQIGTADEIYERPTTRFVADFVGQINLLDGTLSGRADGFAAVSVAGRILRAPDVAGAADAVSVGVRPEQITLTAGDTPPPGANALSGTVAHRQFAGNRIKLEVDIGESLIDGCSGLYCAIGKINAIWPCLSNVDAEADSAVARAKAPESRSWRVVPGVSGGQACRSRRLRTQSVSIRGDAGHAYAPQAAGAARRGLARR